MAMLSAVDFVLCVLSMFGRVIDENRMAVEVLLEAIKSYNSLTKQFGKRAVKQVGYGGRSSVRALAAYLGKDYTMKELRTDEGAQAVLHTILDPVIGSLTRQELAKMRRDMDEAIHLASSAPMEEVRAKVTGFVLRAWVDGRREQWMAMWKKGVETRTIETLETTNQGGDVIDDDDDDDHSTSTAVDIHVTGSTCDFAVVPVMATVKRRRRVPIGRRSTSFPSPVDVCLGRSSSSASGRWYEDTSPVWHPHGWKMFHPATDQKMASPVDFKFPPPGMVSSTKSDTSPTATLVDPERALEMSAKLKQWEDEWEKEQLGTWKEAIAKDDALWFIVEWTRDMRIWHPHGWKKFDGTARCAHKATGFRFPTPGSLPPVSAAIGTVNLEGSANMDTKYKKWEDSWETEQLGKWSAGLKMRTTREDVGLWSRLAMAWKSERVDLWTSMVHEEEGDMEPVQTTTTLAAKLGRVFGLA